MNQKNLDQMMQEYNETLEDAIRLLKSIDSVYDKEENTGELSMEQLEQVTAGVPREKTNLERPMMDPDELSEEQLEQVTAGVPREKTNLERPMMDPDELSEEQLEQVTAGTPRTIGWELPHNPKQEVDEMLEEELEQVTAGVSKVEDYKFVK